MKSIITTVGICLLITGATRIIAQEQKDKDTGLKAKEIIVTKATVQDVDKDKREVM